MVITETTVKMFERQQREHGTYTAMHNLLWSNASELLKDLGIKRVTTTLSTRVRRKYKNKEAKGK